jgi:NIPSNAP
VSHSAECNIEVYGEIGIEAWAWYRKTIAPGTVGNFTFEGTWLASLRIVTGAMTEPTAESLKPARSSRLCCPIVELRHYTLHPGKRDVLIDLFDREFIETQEAVGIKVIGQFRNVDDPDRFVWLRGFRDMTSRAKALQDFYGGPVWKAHREAANPTMIDSDNVLLLRPALPTSGFSLENTKRPLSAPTKFPRAWSLLRFIILTLL